MFLRVFSFLLIIIFCTSCDFFSTTTNKNTSTENSIDTIINVSSIDVSPSFSTCDSIIKKAEKTNCFRNTIHQLITEKLAENQLTIKDAIDEIVHVHLLINPKGHIVFKELESSERIKNEFPQLDSLLKTSVESLPKINPATKRGIPVTTQYILPVRIKLEE